MTTKRTPVHRNARTRITSEAVDAYRRRDHLALHRALGLRPYMPSPIGAVGPSPWARGTAGFEWWPHAVELREQLEAELRDLNSR